MPMLPRQANPLAETIDEDADTVFPGERLSRVCDFVRLRVAAQSVSFVALLVQEGIAPSYYAAMVARFDEVRRVNQRVNETFLRRFAEAVRRS